MLQVFHLDVAKVDRNVAHVAVAIHVCSSVSSKCFILFFRHMFANVASEYWICFHTCEVFSCIFCKCFICMFRVFQLFRTYVANVPSRCFKSRYGVAANVSDTCFMCLIYL
jgi:hypothetical protein